MSALSPPPAATGAGPISTAPPPARAGAPPGFSAALDDAAQTWTALAEGQTQSQQDDTAATTGENAGAQQTSEVPGTAPVPAAPVDAMPADGTPADGAEPLLAELAAALNASSQTAQIATAAPAVMAAGGDVAKQPAVTVGAAPVADGDGDNATAALQVATGAKNTAATSPAAAQNGASAVPAPVGAAAAGATAEAVVQRAVAAAGGEQVAAPAAVAARGADVAAPAAPASNPIAAPVQAAPAQAGPVLTAQPVTGAAPSAQAEAIEALVQLTRSRGQAGARIALAPEELGGIRVTLQMGPDGITARMIAERPEAAAALQRAGGDLRASLAQQGIDLARLDTGFAGQGDTRDPRAGATAGDGGRGGNGHGSTRHTGEAAGATLHVTLDDPHAGEPLLAGRTIDLRV